MTDCNLASLHSENLARRLRELAGSERNVQVDFLLHLDEFDRRRAFLEAGFDSLWTYCLQALHLREGPAGRRIGAMRVLRRFPALEAPLRDARLCLSTVTLLGPLLTGENLDDLVARAAYRTKAEVEHLVASLHPRAPPRDGVRRLTERAPATGPAVSLEARVGPGLEAQSMAAAPPAPGSEPGASTAAPDEPGLASTTAGFGGTAGFRMPLAVAQHAPVRAPEARRPTELRAVSAEDFSLRVTIDAGLKADLETLTGLLAHKTGGALAEVLREAIRCGIEKHAKRRGAESGATNLHARIGELASRRGVPIVDVNPEENSFTPTRVVTSPPSRAAGRGRCGPVVQESTRDETENCGGAGAARGKEAARRATIPVAVRREVWRRDGGRCTWEGADGRRCGSGWKLELDHVQPVALGGTSDLANLRLLCRGHNLLHARHLFGREHMDRFGRSAHPGMSVGAC